MARDPIFTLIELNTLTAQLNEVQLWVDQAVAFARKNNADEHFYQELYKQQLEIDQKRKFVQDMMIFIPMNN